MASSVWRKAARRAALLLPILLLVPAASLADCSQSSDADGDGLCYEDDNCSEFWNPTQLDVDGDGFGNACDCDFDDDGVCDLGDFSILLGDFVAGSDSGGGTDMTGNGSVDVLDFLPFLVTFQNGVPGPADTEFADEARLAALGQRRSIAGGVLANLPKVHLSTEAGGDLPLGDDTAEGTAATPVATLHRAAELCQALGRCELVIDSHDVIDEESLDDGTDASVDFAGTGFQIDVRDVDYRDDGRELAYWIHGSDPGQRWTIDCNTSADGNGIDAAGGATEVWGSTDALFQSGKPGGKTGEAAWMVVEGGRIENCGAATQDGLADDDPLESFDVFRASGKGRLLVLDTEVIGFGGRSDQLCAAHDAGVCWFVNGEARDADTGSVDDFEGGGFLRAAGNLSTQPFAGALNSTLVREDRSSATIEALLYVQGNGTGFAVDSWLESAPGPDATPVNQSVVGLGRANGFEYGRAVVLGSLLLSTHSDGVVYGGQGGQGFYGGLSTISVAGASFRAETNAFNRYALEGRCLILESGTYEFLLRNQRAHDFLRMDLRQVAFDADQTLGFLFPGLNRLFSGALTPGSGSGFLSFQLGSDGRCAMCDFGDPQGSVDVGGESVDESPFIGGFMDTGTDLSAALTVPPDEDLSDQGVGLGGGYEVDLYHSCSEVLQTGTGNVPALPNKAWLPEWVDGRGTIRGFKLNAGLDRSYGAR